MTRKEILQAAEKCVCGQRENDYGKPEDNFRTIAALWNAYLGVFNITGVDVANMMILLKIARAKNGGTDDCFTDVAGYAACAGEIRNRLNGELNE